MSETHEQTTYVVVCRAPGLNPGELDRHVQLQAVDDEGHETYRGPIAEYPTEEAAQAVADSLQADEPAGSDYLYYVALSEE